MDTKKSAIDLTELAIGIVILGIVTAIGATILLSLRDSRLTDLDTYAVSNETLTTVNQLGDSLTGTWVNGVTLVKNATGGETIGAGNYTVTISDVSGVATLKAVTGATGGYNNTNWKVDYSVYNLSGTEYSIPNEAAQGLGEYGNWFDILVIVGIAAVILSLIFLAFGKMGGGSDNYSQSY